MGMDMRHRCYVVDLWPVPAGKTRAVMKKEYSAAFEAWWAIYPRKVVKTTASPVFEKLIKEDQQKAIDVLPTHVAYWKACDRPIDKIPHPRTWLNQRRFDDVIEMPKKKKVESFMTDWFGDDYKQEGTIVGEAPIRQICDDLWSPEASDDVGGCTS